ncbi:MAG: membrane-bound PQQ-dependent dehydrogenase, glucose/quinate/shikimate family, partial [Steroidobacteraceae bacterium]
MSARIFAVVLMLLGAALLNGGIRLIAAGGTFYYAIAGITVVYSGALLWRGGKPLASHIYGALLLATLVWSLFEVGTDLWALMPRLALLAL